MALQHSLKRAGENYPKPIQIPENLQFLAGAINERKANTWQ